MKQLNELTVEDIESMDYNNLISVVRETNRVPGGFATLQEIANVAGIRNCTRVLEIGTSTGISAIEMVRITGCKIESIDINERSIQEASKRAKQEGLDPYINFSVQDARNTSFDSESFQVVFCGNVTSLIPEREKALEEYYRLLAPGGFLSAVPMYYIEIPSEKLISDVRRAIQTDVEACDKKYWLDFFKHSNLCYKYVRDYKFDYIPDKKLEEFIAYILGKPHLKALKDDTYDALKKKYTEYIYLFRDNLSYMGYSIILLSKEINNDEPELFTGSRI
ncbi:MAG: class I SAM-dependent methyltransferase [Lachnospiraceae bacterium]|nr:class I SAM-dependent methyltransferase [Lachnospiraceae bacterium]